MNTVIVFTVAAANCFCVFAEHMSAVNCCCCHLCGLSGWRFCPNSHIKHQTSKSATFQRPRPRATSLLSALRPRRSGGLSVSWQNELPKIWILRICVIAAASEIFFECACCKTLIAYKCPRSVQQLAMLLATAFAACQMCLSAARQPEIQNCAIWQAPRRKLNKTSTSTNLQPHSPPPLSTISKRSMDDLWTISGRCACLVSSCRLIERCQFAFSVATTHKMRCATTTAMPAAAIRTNSQTEKYPVIGVTFRDWIIEYY